MEKQRKGWVSKGRKKRGLKRTRGGKRRKGGKKKDCQTRRGSGGGSINQKRIGVCDTAGTGVRLPSKGSENGGEKKKAERIQGKRGALVQALGEKKGQVSHRKVKRNRQKGASQKKREGDRQTLGREGSKSCCWWQKKGRKNAKK